MVASPALYSPIPLGPHGYVSSRDRVRIVSRGRGRCWEMQIRGVRESFTVAGTHAGGGVLQEATLDNAPERPWLEIGSEDEYYGIMINVRPPEDTTEALAVVQASVLEIPAWGKPRPASQRFWLTSAKDNQIYVELGTPWAHATRGSAYRIVLAVASTQSPVRQVKLKPVVCRT